MPRWIPRIRNRHNVLAYGGEKTIRGRLWLALFMSALMVLVLFIADNNSDRILAGSALAAGVLWITIELVSLYQRKPLLVLSPDGIAFKLEWVRYLLIPWSQIRAVDTADIEGYDPVAKVQALFKDVTVIRVSREYYERHLDPGSFLLRGPAWENLFQDKGAEMQMALHHDILPNVTGPQLRQEIETRWKAFRGDA